jgi:hypothetical protein
VFSADNSRIHEANINVIGRNYYDQRDIKYYNINPENKARVDLESRQRK